MAEPIDVACPKCGAEAGKRCRTLTTNRSTDTHEARWFEWFAARNTPPERPLITGKYPRQDGATHALHE